MNISEINTTNLDKPALNPGVAANKAMSEPVKLSEQMSKAEQAMAEVSAPKELAIRVASNAISLEIGMGKQDVPKSLTLDFEQVVTNVLNFIQKSVAKQKEAGVETEGLQDMLDQATRGVSAGVKYAKEDLAGMLSPELNQQINKTEGDIHQGISDIRNGLDAKFTYYEQHARSESSTLTLTTAQGDKVDIQFSARAEQQTSFSQYTDSQELGFGVSQSHAFSFSVQGELNDDESRAITDLLKQADIIANEFYNGNIQQAMDNALSMGFDKSEIQGFAIQLRQQTVSEKMLQYEAVKHTDEKRDFSPNAPKAVAEYMNKLLDVMQGSAQAFGNEKSYNDIINGIVNQMKDVQIPDLVTAINRFHTFNAGLLKA